MTDANDENGDADAGDQEPLHEWTEIGSCKANEGPVWRAIWGPREYGTSVLVSIAGSVVNVWGESSTPDCIPADSLITTKDHAPLRSPY